MAIDRDRSIGRLAIALGVVPIASLVSLAVVYAYPAWSIWLGRVIGQSNG